MPPPENKTPFKSMNIKSALLAAATRKRKAASPNLPVKHIKNIDDAKQITDDEIEIVTEDCDIAAIGDCKENTDLNGVKSELNLPAVEKTSPPLNSVQKDYVKSETIQNSDLSACDRSLLDSSDDLNSSNLNNSLNALHSNELSENDETQSKSEADLSPTSKKRNEKESTFKSPSEVNQKDTGSKRKRKMTSEEAKKKSEAREQKRKELLEKKRLLDAQKLQKKLEKEQLRIQKEIERQEKENERKAKEKQKQEKKEQEEREKQQKLKEKEDQKKIRQQHLEMKLEEKKKKEELKLKREEEMKKADEEKQKAKLEKEQKEKEKLERNKAAFMKFFVASNKTTTVPVVPQVVEKEGVFKPFQVSDDMTLAPVVPPIAQERFNKDKLDQSLKLFQSTQELYLQILKSGKYKDVRLRKRLRKQRTCDDVIVIDNVEPSELFLKAKLLQFSENVRPPYWGTWRKQSTKVRPRNPFAQEDIFDYAVDSDDEWDEGGPGESLSGTENEIESEDDYEVDNEFFVPHGYLSAEEEREEDEVESDPENHKAKLKIKQQEFEMERKKKTTELKPLILGCYIENLLNFQDPGLSSFLQVYAGELLLDSPILTCLTVKKLQAESKLPSNASSPVIKQSSSIKKKNFPEEAMPHLIRLVHGNINSRDTLVKEFQSFWWEQGPVSSEDTDVTNKKPAEVNPQEPNPDTALSEPKKLSKRQLYILIKKIATYGKSSHPAIKKSCWYVHDDVREKYGLQDAPIPNEWNYQSVREEGEATASPVTKNNCASIKGFLIP